MRAVVARGIKKSFTHPTQIDLLTSIDLEVESGETVAIVGASGEGKSTLLQILATLESSSGGELELLGQKVAGLNLPRFRNQHIGFVFQSFHLLDDESALSNVLLPAWIGRRRGELPRRRAVELLDEVGLSHRVHFPVKLLSGGERQRVAIARALCNDPDLLFADEPSGNLDHANSQAIHDLLLSCAKRRGKTLVIVTHNRTLADRCDRSYTLCSGRLE